MLYKTNVGNQEHDVVIEFDVDYYPAEPSVGVMTPSFEIIDFLVVEFNGFDRFSPEQCNSLDNYLDLDRIVKSLIKENEMIEHWQEQSQADEEYYAELAFEDRCENPSHFLQYEQYQ